MTYEQDRLTVTALLKKLKEKNDQENNDVLKQFILPPDPIAAPKIASLKTGHYLLMSPMLEARFRFAGRWTNASLGFTWLSVSDMEDAWTNGLAQEAITLRREHWPTSVLNQHIPDNLALFATDIDDGNEIYLIFSEADEPQVVTYFGAQEKRYDNLRDYIVGDGTVGLSL